MCSLASCRRAFERAAATALVLFGFSVSATAASLGVASNYNALIFDSYKSVGGDSEGPLAVGGNVTLSQFGLNTAGVAPTALVVGGKLSLSNGQINGNVVYQGNQAPSVSSNAKVNGTITAGQPIDFAAAKNYYEYLSDSLFGLAGTGSVSNYYGTLKLVADGTSDLNVFNLSSSQLSNINGWDLRGVKAGSTVVINISGTPQTLSNFGMQGQFSAYRNNILFNLPDAMNFSLSGISLQGSVLAPSAAFSVKNGNLEGTLIANSFTNGGGGEIHYDPFQGTLFAPMSSVPEPGSGLMFAGSGALLTIIGLVRRRRANRG